MAKLKFNPESDAQSWMLVSLSRSHNMSNATLTLALDIGSSSIRCSAFTYCDDQLSDAIATKSHKLQSVESGPLGRIRVMDVLYYVDVCVESVLCQLRRLFGDFCVKSIGISTFVMNLVGVDSAGKPIMSWDGEQGENGEGFADASLSYACHADEVAQECRSIQSSFTSDKLETLRQETGTYIHSSYALPQLCSISRLQKDHRSQLCLWTSIASLIISRWSGISIFDIPISFSEASWTGMFNFRTCQWHKTLTNYHSLNVANYLPRISNSFDDNFLLNAKSSYVSRWPEIKNVMFMLGMGDGACANIGSKATTMNRIAVTIGTSAAARVIIPFNQNQLLEPFHVPCGLWCYRINYNYVLVGGSLTDGGSVIEWSRQLLNLKDDILFTSCMEEVRKLIKTDELYHEKNRETDISKSLTMIPFLSGERSLGWRANATGCILNITRETTPAHFLRACMEGVMLRLTSIIDILILLSKSSDDIHLMVSGTALEKNDVWRYMLANYVTEKNVIVVVDRDGVRESTSRGIALLAQKFGHDENNGISHEILNPVVLEHKNITPYTEIYLRALKKQQERLIDSVSPTWL